jgi:hypothetical protein
MFPPLTMVTLAGAAALAGCSPALDWREVRLEAAPLKITFPCKPEKGSRQVTMAGRTVALDALACEAGGSTFAVLSADVGGPASADSALQQWQAASLATMRGQAVRESRFVPNGALDLPRSVQVAASGQRSDGKAIQAQVAYFARGNHVFQAAVYSERLEAEATEPFFAGLRFE